MAEYVTIGEALPAQVDGLDVLGAVCNNMVVPLAAPSARDQALSQPRTCRCEKYWTLGFTILKAALFAPA